MITEPQVLARNTSYFTLALVAQKVISFLYFTFLARTLGPENIGRYVLAISITTIFSILLDVGLAQVLIREVARDQTLAQKYFSLTVGFKLVASLVVVGLVYLTVNALGYPTLTKELVYIACAVMVLDSFVLSAYSTIRGFHTLTWESVGTVGVQATLAVTGFIVSRFTHNLRWFMFALVLAVAANAIYSLSQLGFRFKVKFQPMFNWQGWRKLFIISWPFALAGVLTRIFGYSDSVLLSLLSTERSVGIYSVAYKITFALQFIPTAFAASLFPGFSVYFVTAPQKMADTFMRAIIYLTAIATPVSLGIISLAPEIISTIYPKFTDAIVPLQILIFSLIFLFITFPVGSLLPACNRQERNTFNLGLAAVANIVFNLWLIPLWGPTGAAIASLLSTTVLLVAGWVVVERLVDYDHKFLFTRLFKILCAGVLMSLLVWLVKPWLNFVLVIPLAALWYLFLLILFKGVTWEELSFFWNIILRKKSAV